MGRYQKFADTPNQIQIEGQEITLKFKRNGDGTATVSWNIPPGINGCSSDEQSYDGFLVTVDTIPADYLTTSPKDGVFYNSDNTSDIDLHTGDKIGSALVVGAFYDDKKTTKLTITDIDPRTNYYVSGYAVDNVRTYHREGVHAYSLPTGSAEKIPDDKNAYHDIFILSREDLSTPIQKYDLTGLSSNIKYTLHIKINSKEYTLNLDGSDILDYSGLIDAINLQCKLLLDPYQSPHPYNYDKYYVDKKLNIVQYWDGYKNIQEKTVFSTFDPNTKPSGTYWYNPNSDEIYIYETGGWSLSPFIAHDTDPTLPECGTLWFTGTDVYEWDGDHWCELCLYIQTRNPILPPILDCNTFWYNESELSLNKWDTDIKKWDEVDAIISSIDPNSISTGIFWYNDSENDEKVYRYVGGSWNEVQNVRYEPAGKSGSIAHPKANSYWFNTTTLKFYKRSSNNTTWIEQDYVMAMSDPLERSSCDIWWNQSPSVDSIYIWDIINNQWLLQDNFYQSESDPSKAQKLPPCVVWYNPTDDTLKYVIKNTCTDKGYIKSPFDPTVPVVGTVWKDKNNDFFAWDGASWNSISPLIYEFDPFNIDIDYFWYDQTTNKLFKWNGTGWDILSFVIHPLTPNVGQLWFDTVNNILYKWNNEWIVDDGIAIVECKYADTTDRTYDGKAYLHFHTTDVGCKNRIEVVINGQDVFSKVKQSVIYTIPMPGSSGVVSGPMYKQLGVGTDGSPDERRELHGRIRTMLGDSGIRVELTKEDLDTCIDLALLNLRKHSNFGYKRGFFFVDVEPNQQIYKLTNQCVGFNKIAYINSIHRMQAGFFRAGFAGNDLFGFAALQQLYTIGTFDMVSFHLMSAYIEELQQLFAARIMFQWVERDRELRLYQRISYHERVLVDGSIERTEQDLITSRDTAMWITNWCVAEAKMILYNVRGKYQTLPGPNGSTTLNADTLASQAMEEKRILMEQLTDDYTMQDLTDIGMGAHFVIG